MEQGERIKQIRTSLGLTLEKFGDRLGVTKVAISNIEKGNRNLTEQMTKAICREFNVDYMWLTTGEGEMFVATDDDFQARIDQIMFGQDESRKNLFKMMIDMSDEDIHALERILKNISSFYENQNKEDKKELAICQLRCTDTEQSYKSASGFYRRVSSPTCRGLLFCNS